MEETIMKKENQEEALEICSLVERLKPSERKDFLMFLKGIQFAQNYSDLQRLE